MAISTTVIRAPQLSAGASGAAHYESRAATFLGTTRLFTYWEDFQGGLTNSSDWTRTVGGGGGGVIDIDNDRAGGILQVTSGASASSRLTVGSTTTGFPGHIPGGSTATWYFASRLRKVSTLAAGVELVLGFSDNGTSGSATMVLGARNTTSTTHFVFYSSNAAAYATTTAALDESWHVFEVYRVGGVTTILFDGTSVFSNANGYSANAGGPYFLVDGNSSNKTLECDFLFTSFPNSDRVTT